MPRKVPKSKLRTWAVPSRHKSAIAISSSIRLIEEIQRGNVSAANRNNDIVKPLVTPLLGSSAHKKPQLPCLRRRQKKSRSRITTLDLTRESERQVIQRLDFTGCSDDNDSSGEHGDLDEEMKEHDVFVPSPETSWSASNTPRDDYERTEENDVNESSQEATSPHRKVLASKSTKAAPKRKRASVRASEVSAIAVGLEQVAPFGLCTHT